MEIGVIGINHKLADLELRETLAKACQRHFGLMDPDHDPHQFLLLSTCNRTEIYFHSPHLSEAQAFVLKALREEVHGDFDQKLYSFFQEDCFHHLCRVTAGLDSAVACETEIQGQVKIAYESRISQGELPSSLHYAFQKALKVGKTVRTRLPATSLPSIEQAILTKGLRFFRDRDPTLLFIGASHINGKVIEYFKRRGVTNIAICNRSHCQAERFALKYGIAAADWNKSHWLQYDWLIFGTRAQQPLLLKADIHNHSPLIIDLGVPRNVEPGAVEHLYNIDQLNRTLRHKRQKLQAMLDAAEAHVEHHSARLIRCYQAKKNWQLAI